MSGTVYKLFEDKVRAYPDNIAIECNDAKLTYKCLGDRVECLAMRIKQLQCTNVAICIEPSIEAIIAILACLKQRVTYLPLDINYPESYIKAIIDDFDVSQVITSESDDKDCFNVEPMNVNLNDVSNHSESEDVNSEIAYIVTTSGTTGKAKGVLVSHAALINLLSSTNELYHISSKDTVPLLHSLSFDFSIWEIMSALMNGAKLSIAPDAVKKDPKSYIDFIINKKITILNVTPSWLYRLIPIFNSLSQNIIENLNLRLIISGGEPLYPVKLKKWFEHSILRSIAIYNMYGITEGTIHSTYKKIEYDDQQDASSNIGVPLSGVEIEVVPDDKVGSVESGIQGELYLSGVSVTPGYLNNDDNQDVFIHESFKGQCKKCWFKTGDIVKKNHDGDLIYLGRKGGFKKIRGFRVEVDAIKNTLLGHNDISNAYVQINTIDNENLSLSAYIEVGDNKLTYLDVRNYLGDSLPAYMIPEKLYITTSFPLTINGKIDEEALIGSFYNENALVERKDSVGEHIRSIWSQLLDLNDVDININFFDAGGNSLLLLDLLVKLQSQICSDVELIDLVRNPTIAQQEAFLLKR